LVWFKFSEIKYTVRMKDHKIAVERINDNNITDIESNHSEQLKSISEEYSDLYNNSSSIQKQTSRNLVCGFFDRLYLSNSISALYGVFGSSCNGCS
jgi:hypothetical protein